MVTPLHSIPRNEAGLALKTHPNPNTRGFSLETKQAGVDFHSGGVGPSIAGAMSETGAALALPACQTHGVDTPLLDLFPFLWAENVWNRVVGMAPHTLTIVTDLHRHTGTQATGTQAHRHSGT